MLAWETVEEMNASDNRCVSVCCGLTLIEIVNINYLAMMVSSLLMDFLPDHVIWLDIVLFSTHTHFLSSFQHNT